MSTDRDDALPLAKRRQAFGSRLPCHTGVLTLLIEVDTTVASWEHGEGTVDRLRVLVDRGWRPQDSGQIGRMCDELQRWTVSAAELLSPAIAVWLPHACPRCGARDARRRDGCGELVRTQAALRVQETGCSCLACGAFWPRLPRHATPATPRRAPPANVYMWLFATSV